MCDHSAQSFKTSPVAGAVIGAFQRGPCPEKKQADGLRRRRLWELPTETHCPVIGVCLSISTLRKLINKELDQLITADDYELHAAAVAECRARRPISERIQRELERRYALSIRRLANIKTTQALRAAWKETCTEGGVADTLWAALTHPRCDEALCEQICRDVHMFQHQLGAGTRVDLNQLAKLREENAALLAQLVQARKRSMDELAHRDTEITRLQTELANARGRLVARVEQIDQLQEELTELRVNAPDLPERMQLAEQVEQQKKHIQRLERERAAVRVQPPPKSVTPEVCNAKVDEETGKAPRASLLNKAILCVGGRPAAVPVYRNLIECNGARFLHHDGGEDDTTRQLDASLAAADLVICQTGCVSHGAYWRVKDHCKRTGKQCVFVEKPSASSLARCLRTLEGSRQPTSELEK